MIGRSRHPGWIGRRTLLAGIALAPTPARAQGHRKPLRIGLLHPRGSPINRSPRLPAMRAGLAEAARSNRPVELISGVADGGAGQRRAFAQELAALRPDASIAVDLATGRVASGSVASLGRPAGNGTDRFVDVAAFAARCPQIQAESAQPLPRIGVLWAASTGAYQRAAAEPAAAMGIRVDLRQADSPDAVQAAVEGAQAAEMPVERPTRCTLLSNQRAARAGGHDRAPMLLARTDGIVA